MNKQFKSKDLRAYHLPEKKEYEPPYSEDHIRHSIFVKGYNAHHDACKPVVVDVEKLAIQISKLTGHIPWGDLNPGEKQQRRAQALLLATAIEEGSVFK